MNKIIYPPFDLILKIESDYYLATRGPGGGVGGPGGGFGGPGGIFFSTGTSSGLPLLLPVLKPPPGPPKPPPGPPAPPPGPLVAK